MHSYGSSIFIYSPREAAFEIVYLINSRNQNVSLLALAVGHLER